MLSHAEAFATRAAASPDLRALTWLGDDGSEVACLTLGQLAAQVAEVGRFITGKLGLRVSGFPPCWLPSHRCSGFGCCCRHRAAAVIQSKLSCFVTGKLGLKTSGWCCSCCRTGPVSAAVTLTKCTATTPTEH